MGFGFFYVPKHRTFNYKPVFYDERKEELQERIKAAEQAKSETYVPGTSIRGSFKKSREVSRKGVKYTPVMRFISVVTIAAFIAALVYMCNMFGLLG